MRIAITADLHLTSRQQHPERYAALENIFTQLNNLQITTLIIAGDLFDAKFNNFAEFEKVCNQPENRTIQVLVIPGNHDINISQAAFAADNIRIFSQPEYVLLDQADPGILFIPYRVGRSMGELVSEFFNQLKPDGWVLIGHGDWMGNIRTVNDYEPGIYMPLSQRDLDVYQPTKVFLGHIHAQYNGRCVYYPGSPCGMDITETGRRRFLTYDTRSEAVDSFPVDTQYIYFNRSFTFYPVDDEQAAIEGMLKSWIASWELDAGEKSKARVRVKLSGYTSDKGLLKRAVIHTLSGYQLQEDPNLDEVFLTSDVQRGQIINMVKERLDQLDLPAGQDDPNRDQILLAAIKMVYGG